MRRLRSRTGFTVQEILTALLIIFIGNWFIICQSRKARDVARTAACASNVKQLALAMRMYAADNDGLMPPDAHLVTGLNEYLKNWQILRCPSDPTPVVVEMPGLNSGTVALSYVFNTQVRLDDLPGTILVRQQARPAPRTKVERRPARWRRPPLAGQRMGNAMGSGGER